MGQYNSLSLNFVLLQQITNLFVTQALLQRSLGAELARLAMSPKAASGEESKYKVLLRT